VGEGNLSSRGLEENRPIMGSGEFLIKRESLNMTQNEGNLRGERTGRKDKLQEGIKGARKG